MYQGRSLMSISATKRVSSTPVSTRTDRNYGIGRQEEQSVDVIDTTNNVLVRDEDGQEHHDQSPFAKKRRQDFDNATSDISYRNETLDSMVASGIFQEEDSLPNSEQKVGVYTNNQSIIRGKNNERSNQNYLKHFYENNAPIEEIDELV